MNKYPAVYSYRRSRTRELELSLQTLKNIKEWNGEIYIVGDKPVQLHELPFFNHLYIAYSWGRSVKTNDEICAYLTAADYFDDFIVMADDIYILKTWSLEYQNRGTLEEQAKSRRSIDRYAKQLLATQDFLKAAGKPYLSYELHIPFLMNSKQLKEAANMVQVNRPLLIRSLVGNWFKIPSVESIDPKNKPITEETVLYSSDDWTFKYEKVKELIK